MVLLALYQVQADAEVKKTNTQAEADAELIKAEADAELNKKINDSLTDKILENNKIEKWDGKLPLYEGSSRPYLTVDGTRNEFE